MAAALSSSSSSFTDLSTSLPAEAKSGSLALDTASSSVTVTTAINQVGAAYARAVVSAWAMIAALALVFNFVMA